MEQREIFYGIAVGIFSVNFVGNVNHNLRIYWKFCYFLIVSTDLKCTTRIKRILHTWAFSYRKKRGKYLKIISWSVLWMNYMSYDTTSTSQKQMKKRFEEYSGSKIS